LVLCKVTHLALPHAAVGVVRCRQRTLRLARARAPSCGQHRSTLLYSTLLVAYRTEPALCRSTPTTTTGTQCTPPGYYRGAPALEGSPLRGCRRYAHWSTVSPGWPRGAALPRRGGPREAR
jgi:hypothetical protein